MTNSVVLVGRLTKDPELKYSPTGTAVTNFTLAVDGFKKDDTNFIQIVTFQKQAENCANFLVKGRLCAVTGYIETGSYEKDGQRVYTTKVIANNVKFLESAKQEKKVDPFKNEGTPVNIKDEDLPF
jgi:single-strand DNA-binding protein